ncbi:MAG: coniferyl aldehyde dehydrogenase [Desulfosarcina sp.]|nr:coniferyl aldehyde dehydrogenase [Desulfobacterales bacterium]
MTQTAEVLNFRPHTKARIIFERQKAACQKQPFLALAERLAVLQKIESILIDHQEAIADAICGDFGHRSRHETKILEIFPVVSGLRHTRRHLKKWMKPQRRHVALHFAGARNRVIPQPKGVVGIIAPWNYPLFLVLSPLTSALAAGNRCMIKMAADSQRLCNLLNDLFRRAFADDLLAVLPGVSAADFTPLPFDHLIYTGSPASGRTVMKTAADNLTPVTLELGGKSPTIICDDFDIHTAAERILQAKFMNAGQTCVAPDYLFLPQNRVDDFIDEARRIVPGRYPRLDSADYTAIIDAGSYRRLTALLDEARSGGAEIINLLPGAAPDEAGRKIPPTLVRNVHDAMALMQHEIFGPILPIKTYRRLEDAIAYVNARERPLALCLFSNDKRRQEMVVRQTMSGGVSINDCAMHVAQHDMPFGGIGNSGMGQYHGREGFMAFSKLRPVFRQAARPVGAAFLYPPYGKMFDRVYKLLIRLRWI